jgi:hypothetical protein
MTQEAQQQPVEPTIQLSLSATSVAKVIAGLRNVENSKELMAAIDVLQIYELPLSAVNSILAGLGFLMFRDAADVIASIKKQGDEQMIAYIAEQSKAANDKQAAQDGEKKGGE